jgi:hypothetical protein
VRGDVPVPVPGRPHPVGAVAFPVVEQRLELREHVRGRVGVDQPHLNPVGDHASTIPPGLKEGWT